MEQETGRQEIKKGVFIVSGGSMGLSGDIVVDNYLNPRRIIGVADGMGDLKEELSEKDHERLSIIKKMSKHAKT
jgi:adenosine/AMP kinase